MLRSLFVPVFFVILMSYNCENPFSTRSPEEPDSGSITWKQPAYPEIVIENMENSISNKNIENYLRCFGLSEETKRKFNFKPEPSVFENYPNLFLTWNIEKERNYITNIFSLIPDDSLHSLNFTDIDEYIFPDSSRYIKYYDLILHHTNPSLPKHFKGRIDVSLNKDMNGSWFISYWEDIKTEDTPVWSILKASF